MAANHTASFVAGKRSGQKHAFSFVYSKRSRIPRLSTVLEWCQSGKSEQIVSVCVQKRVSE
jgi:hypothetical protein